MFTSLCVWLIAVLDGAETPEIGSDLPPAGPPK
jgi:hypothetical protein